MASMRTRWAFLLAVGFLGGSLALAPPGARGQGQGDGVPTIDKPLHELPTKAIGRTFATYSPDGKVLAIAGAYTIQLWDPARGEVIRRIQFKGMGWLNALAYSPDGKTLASVSDDNQVRLWNPVNGGIRRQIPVQDIVLDAVSFSPDGKTLAAAARPAGGGKGNIYLFDAATGNELRRFGGGRIWTITVPFSPDGKLLAAGGQGTAVQLWDPATGKEVRRLEGEKAPADGPPFARPPRRLTLVLALAFSPDGKTLASGDNDNKITLWDVGTGRKRVVLSMAPLPALGAFGVCTLAYSPDGKTLASAGGDGVVRLWEAATGKERCRLVGHKAQVWSVAFAPDGKTLASTDANAKARIWDVAVPAPARQGAARQAQQSPLEARLVAGKATYALDLGGKTPEQYRKQIEDGKPTRTFPPSPAVALALEFRNTADHAVTFLIGPDGSEPILRLEGKGAVNVSLGFNVSGRRSRPPMEVKLAPKETYRWPIKSLTSLSFTQEQWQAYWTEPGEYTLTATCHTAVSPAPKGTKDQGNGFGRVVITSAPLKLTVTEKK
jgi:Tol biopolymer transport system component